MLLLLSVCREKERVGFSWVRPRRGASRQSSRRTWPRPRQHPGPHGYAPAQKPPAPPTHAPTTHAPTTTPASPTLAPPRPASPSVRATTPPCPNPPPYPPTCCTPRPLRLAHEPTAPRVGERRGGGRGREQTIHARLGRSRGGRGAGRGSLPHLVAIPAGAVGHGAGLAGGGRAGPGPAPGG